MFFFSRARPVQQILQAVCDCGFEMVVELTDSKRVNLLSGFRVEEGIVIGRSADLNPVRIPIKFIHGILRIKNEPVIGEDSPLPPKRDQLQHYQLYGHGEVFLDSPRLSTALAQV
jgi:hypothetical protein